MLTKAELDAIECCIDEVLAGDEQDMEAVLGPYWRTREKAIQRGVEKLRALSRVSKSSKGKIHGLVSKNK